ncbi:MAG: hypothetical protein GQ574_25910 [Crocinitomix sp.]|nr:hypothetical protein [Crocinitomix sp.]
MKKIALFIILIANLSFGQTSRPYYQAKKITIAPLIRGKVIGMQLFEDLLHLNYSGGLELRFLNYHSIGADLVYFRNRHENESQDSITNAYFDNGFSDFDRRRYLNLDYRFYLNFWRSHNIRLIPYVNLFTKIGDRHQWNQYKNIFSRYEPYNYKANFNKYGFTIGFHLGFGSEGRMGLDFNVGALKANNTLIYSTGDNTNSFVAKQWNPHARLNLFFYLIDL